MFGRRLFVGASAAALAVRPVLAQTAAWPARPVRIIVNFGPGGSTDNAMRPFAERLSRALGQQFVIENKGGASGALGMEAAVRAQEDGYTFLATPTLSMTILPHLRKLHRGHHREVEIGTFGRAVVEAVDIAAAAVEDGDGPEFIGHLRGDMQRTLAKSETAFCLE